MFLEIFYECMIWLSLINDRFSLFDDSQIKGNWLYLQTIVERINI